MELEKKTACGCGHRSLVGRVTSKERDEILMLFERKNGLTELAHSLAEAEDEALKHGYFYEKLVMDMGKTIAQYQQWWDERAKVHQWEKNDGEVWEIDFATCQVFALKTSLSSM